MNISQMVREELTAALGDNAENISSDVFQQVADGASAARQALGSDALYENFLARQARRLQAAEAEEAETERAHRQRWGKFLDYDDKPAAPVLSREFFE